MYMVQEEFMELVLQDIWIWWDIFIIKSLDVASLYPNIPIAYDFYIEHLGPEFLKYIKNIVGVRLAEKSKPKNLQDKSNCRWL